MTYCRSWARSMHWSTERPIEASSPRGNPRHDIYYSTRHFNEVWVLPGSSYEQLYIWNPAPLIPEAVDVTHPSAKLLDSQVELSRLHSLWWYPDKYFNRSILHMLRLSTGIKSPFGIPLNSFLLCIILLFGCEKKFTNLSSHETKTPAKVDSLT